MEIYQACYLLIEQLTLSRMYSNLVPNLEQP